MQLTAIILLACCLHLSAKTVSQTISINGKDLKLENILSIVKEQTGFTTLYDEEELKNARPVSIHAINQPLDKFLRSILKDQPFQFSIKNKNIILTAKNEKSITEILSEELPPIKGRVTDAEGNPVSGVSVAIKGTNIGTTTDAYGNFELSTSEGQTIVLSSVEFETREIKVGKDNSINISLNRAVSSLNEVVVNKGYYTTTQKLNTGNVSKVSAKDIERQPVSNPLQTLQGRVPGLEITQQSGIPGANLTVRIRGQNSISQGNEPLYIVDGVPFTSTSFSIGLLNDGLYGNPAFGGGTNPLNMINPLDIESIEVLKDADATAIYGSRGANGVILITTKKGKLGKTRIDLNAYAGTGRFPKALDVMKTEDYLTMRKQAYANDGITEYPDYEYDINGAWDQSRYTDWQKEFLNGSANYTDAQMRVSGGTQYTQYTLGGGYHKETTVFPASNNDKRSSFQFGLANISDNKRFRSNLSVNYAVGKSNLLTNDLTSAALTLSPNAPAMLLPDGTVNWQNNTFNNPLAYIKRRYDNITNNLVANLSLSYEVLTGLEIKTSLAYTNISSEAMSLSPLSTFLPTPGVEHMTVFGNTNLNNWQIEPQLNWNKKIRKNTLSVSAGGTFLNQERESSSVIATGFSSESQMKDLSSASLIQQGGSSYAMYRYIAGFGRLTYSYDEKYIINITGRRDGSSRFGPGRQFANFGAVGLGWVFSEESFAKQALPFLSFGKLRGSYGTSGNDQLQDYAYLDTYQPNNVFQSITALNPNRLSNSILAWESIKKFEVALELGFLQDNIRFAGSYYRNRSSNQLLAYPLAPTSGFSGIDANLPAIVQNAGLELEVSTTNFTRRNFSWTTSFNISIPKNKLIEYPDFEQSSVATRYVIGQPLSIEKLYHYTGIDQNTGLYTFDDVNGDGSLDSKDQIGFQSIGATLFGGLQNHFRFKGFDLDVSLQFVKKKSMSYLSAFSTPGYSMTNQPSELLGNFWEKSGDNAKYQKLTTSSDAYYAYSNFMESDGALENSSFLRVKNVAIGYNLPDELLRRIGLVNLRLFIQAQNLLTFTSYKGLDPENTGPSLPPLRVATAGVHITL